MAVKKAIWTVKSIEAAVKQAKQDKCDVWLTEAAPRGEGRLRLRARPNGHPLYYFRYVDAAGKQRQLNLDSYDDAAGKQRQLDVGSHDESGRAGLTLGVARKRADKLSALYRAGHRDLHGYLAHQRAEEQARIEAAAAKRREDERQATAGSLRALLEGYLRLLEQAGKVSVKDARNLFKLHVFQAHPEIASMRASDVTQHHLAAILAELVKAGKGRTAAKLRSYLGAAYAAALQAPADPTDLAKGEADNRMVDPVAGAAALSGFNLKLNPVKLIAAKGLAKFKRELDRTLDEDELRVFLKALDERPGLAADAVRLALYLGGQRIAQLLRLKPAEVDLTGLTVKLHDPKGKRPQPRLHVLPLTDPALAIVKRLMETNASHEYLISRSKVPQRAEELARMVSEISAAMVKDGKAKGPFQLRDLRRTCETMLARMGVSRDVRAQVLSHGLSGVQQQHYDRHDYMPEKQRALENWAKRLEQIAKGEAPGPKVVPMKREA